METLTVGELLEALDGVDPDTPIYLAIQPSWPMEYTISRAVLVASPADEMDAEPSDTPTNGNAVYLVEGGQTGYLDGHVRDEIGWS